MDLMCILYGEPNCMHVKDAWVLVILSGYKRVSFYWDVVLSYSMQISIKRAQKPSFESFPTFYMASYLLDIVCAKTLSKV